MRRLLTILGVLVMGLTLATPALAGHRDRSRGHRHYVSPHHQRHYVGGYRGVYRPTYNYRPRVRSGFYLGFGSPGYAFGGYYDPAPYHCGPRAVYYPEPVWIPGHYEYDDGVRFYARGYWSR